MSETTQHRSTQPYLTQVYDLLLIELTNWRWSWRAIVVIATCAPLLSMIALGIFARDSGTEALGFVYTGNLVLSIMFGVMGNVTSHFSFMRTNGVLTYFATLPIKKSALVLAVVIAFFLLTLPSLLVTMVAGALFLGVDVRPNLPLLLITIPLCVMPMAGIGALIGVRSRNPEEAGAINLLVTFVMMGLGAVIIPPSRLPTALLALSRLSPATYAASAMRQALLGPTTTQIAIDLIALVSFTLIIYLLIDRWLEWRHPT